MMQSMSEVNDMFHILAAERTLAARDLRASQRMAWPAAAVVILGLSTALWLGVGAVIAFIF